MEQNQVSNSIKFYRLSHLTKTLDVSGSSIWAWVKKGTFPKPIKLSANCTAWNADDIEEWAAERIAVSQKFTIFDEDHDLKMNGLK